MTTIDYGPDVNLEDLLNQLMRQAALLLIAMSGLLIMQSLRLEPIPFTAMGMLALPLGVGGGVWVLAKVHPSLARHLLVWGLTATLLIALGVFSEPWLPFLGLILTFIGSVLLWGSGFVVAGLTAALATWLTYNGVRTYPLSGLLVTLGLASTLAWMVLRALYTALAWAWTMQQRADHLLELARDRQGELASALKSLDIANSILRRTQRELIVARRQAEQARLMKEQFAANVSHELRTPLNLILGFSEIMCLSSEAYEDMEWSPTLRRDIYRIYQSSRHLLEMINDILELSRFEMVGFTLKKEPTQLKTLIEEAAETVDDLFRGRPIQLEVKVTPNLPMLEIDRTRIRQVLLNLLNNAARFTERGTVRLEATSADGEVVVSVSDTGPGIPVDELPHLFQEFYQVDRSLSRKRGGTGLGLAISKAFVESHDGRIWVESEEGVGSTFTFTLPIPSEHIPFSRLQEGRPLELSSPKTPPTILVVDPDPAVATFIDRHLEEYDVVRTDSADRLTEQVMLHHPNAVVYNTLPGRQSDCDAATSVPVPIIECSLPSQARVANGLAVRACLIKPIRADQLLREIDRIGDVHDVLVVDDDLGFCQLVERMLEANDRALDIRRAYSGADALLALRSRRPDVLLLDLIMPDQDGFWVLEEMRREMELTEVPVILVTATSLAEDALAQCEGQIVIRRPGGLRPVEVLRYLQAIVGVLEPHYDERWESSEALLIREM